MKNFACISTFVISCLATSLSAQFWSDDASATSYDTGWTDGCGATTDLGCWTFTDVPGTGLITHQSIDAAAVAGASVMNTSGRAWVTTMNNPSGGGLTWEGRRYWSAPFPSVSTGKIFVDVQMVPSPAGASQHICAIEGASNICASIATRTGFTWFVNGSIDTGIPGIIPIRIKYTFVDAATFDIEISDLTGTFPTFSTAGIAHMGADLPTNIHFIMSDVVINDQSAMIINNLTVDPSGTLPVELDYFMVE